MAAQKGGAALLGVPAKTQTQPMFSSTVRGRLRIFIHAFDPTLFSTE
jgi:hypothetical protein